MRNVDGTPDESRAEYRGAVCCVHLSAWQTHAISLITLSCLTECDTYAMKALYMVISVCPYCNHNMVRHFCETEQRP